MSSALSDDMEVEAEQDGRLREAVAGLLSGSKLERLLSLWRECRSRQQHCSVTQFVERVTQELQLDTIQAGQLRIKLFGAVLKRSAAPSRPVTKAAPPPAAVPPRKPVRSPAQDAATQVFLGLVDALDSLARSRFPAQWSSLCTSLARRLSGLTSVHEQLLRVDAAPAALVAEVHDEAARQALVHHYYLALCEVLGPMPADRLLSSAVQRVEQQPAAARYPPRWLL